MEIVELNVGGVAYTTTKATLCSRDGLLSSIMSGDAREYRDREIFIDRNGQLFRYVLDFLRDGELCLPFGFTEHDQLRRELRHFGLPATTPPPSCPPFVEVHQRKDLAYVVAEPAPADWCPQLHTRFAEALNALSELGYRAALVGTREDDHFVLMQYRAG
eukprot:TRINITY_DN19595_c0_g1_i1.p1 TRINITY_DN19595_c0_g1~~TRINITY_DN19595_c0_g1_i1.p1  ORF type:complete len:177 (-),score=55.03 TRINITY_DN19595_c0_g1_i1:152-631(-)